MVLGKVDSETSLNMPEGSASLGGAEFTVKYYPTLGDITGLTPKYTWVITTGDDGFARIPDDELPFVTDSNNVIVKGLPVGTITIQETKAPIGYLIDSTVYLRQIKTNILDVFETYNMPIIPEQVIRGGFKMQKTDKETGQAQAQGAASLQNATYTVTNISGQSVRVGAGTTQIILWYIPLEQTKTDGIHLLPTFYHTATTALMRRLLLTATW